MFCQFCHLELEALEPIYRLSLGPVVGQGVRAWFCKPCLDKSVPIWLDQIPVFREQNCEHCKRPVFIPLNWKPKRTICSAKCRSALGDGQSEAASNQAQGRAPMPDLQEEIYSKTDRSTVLLGCLQTGGLPPYKGSIRNLIETQDWTGLYSRAYTLSSVGAMARCASPCYERPLSV
jgi:hypothetical protein